MTTLELVEIYVFLIFESIEIVTEHTCTDTANKLRGIGILNIMIEFKNVIKQGL